MTRNQRHGVLFDLDGTLVDSVYQHVRIWHDVLAEHGFTVPHWKVHRGIGLPSDRLLSYLLGERPADAKKMSEEHERRFLDDAPSLRSTAGAEALLDELEERRVPFCAVTSAAPETRDALFKALARTLPCCSPKAGEKPNPEPLVAAAAELGLEPGQVTMIGDAVWDGEAARRCGAHFIGLRCGGTADSLLRQAGAIWVEDAPRDLMGRL
jgi:HAD superfamily hydrolase (TIGR01549 family)